MRQFKVTESITKRTEGLETYLLQISRIQLISPQEEVELVALISAGDQDAKSRLIQGNLRFVVSVAKQYQGSGLSLQDLIQEGNRGLIRAVDSFDPTRGFKFISYAVWWIRQSIIQGLSEFSRLIRLPMNQVVLLTRINQAVSEFEQQNGRNPSDEEIAELIDFPTGKISRVKVAGMRPYSFDMPLDESEDSSSLIDVFPDRGVPSTDYALEIESLSHDIREAIMILSPRDRDVVVMAFGLGDRPSMTLEEIAEEMQLTKERIRQIKERAIRKLRESGAARSLVQYL